MPRSWTSQAEAHPRRGGCARANGEGAAALLAEVGALPLSEADCETLAGDLTTPAELAADLRS